MYTDTLNTQVHETTKHTPYELVFGQPPRSLVIPDPTLCGKIDEEELAEVQCTCIRTILLPMMYKINYCPLGKPRTQTHLQPASAL